MEFNIGCKFSDVYIFEERNNLSVFIFELKIYQEDNIEKQKLIPLQISKNISDRVVHLLIYKNDYVLIGKLHIFWVNIIVNSFVEDV